MAYKLCYNLLQDHFDYNLYQKFHLKTYKILVWYFSHKSVPFK
ncbi:hypothetical protein RC62_772 [Flavobacterium aquidurense]|uniref:Uncharacterized protein n=1 Tax=Flavobacterium aquidurense TaxID=362413 RepID=A0A0Q0W6Q8_9FLAO|nr:hypothetical protein RC62_772 [Flavobacterium aquidurense]